MPTNDPTDVFKLIRMRDKDQCWEWLGTWGGRPDDRRPYFQAGHKRKLSYRWVYELVHGSVPDGKLLRHTCDNGNAPIGCCNPAHLVPGDNQDNMNDMKSRQRHGLPHTAVRAIRKLLDQGVTQQEVADRYGVSRETISAVATGRVYSHVTEVPKQEDLPDV